MVLGDLCWRVVSHCTSESPIMMRRNLRNGTFLWVIFPMATIITRNQTKLVPPTNSGYSHLAVVSLTATRTVALLVSACLPVQVSCLNSRSVCVSKCVCVFERAHACKREIIWPVQIYINLCMQLTRAHNNDIKIMEENESRNYDGCCFAKCSIFIWCISKYFFYFKTSN